MNNLENIFNNEFITKAEDYVEIEEKQPNENYKLSFEFQGESFYILKTGHRFFEHYKDIFDENDYRILRQICDGVILKEEKVLFIELKKTLNISTFKKALSQLIATYLKTRILLEKFWDFENPPIVLIIGNCYIDKDIYSQHKQSIALSSLGNLGLTFYELIKNQEAKLKFLLFENEKFELYREVVNTFREFQKENVIILLKQCSDCEIS